MPVSPTVARLRGVYRPGRHGSRRDPPDTCEEIGAPPAKLLSPEARRVWYETIAMAPHLAPCDRQFLLLFCEASARWQATVRALAAATDPAQAEILRKQVREAQRDVTSAGRSLALTPPERARLAGDGEQAVEDHNPWDDLVRLRSFVIKGGRRGGEE
jgi:phage terminase small subunit